MESEEQTPAVDDDAPMTLAQACTEIFRDMIKPTTLRAEAAKGRLVIERIGRRDFVTRAGVRDMRRLCQVPREKIEHIPNDEAAQQARVDAALAAVAEVRKRLRESKRR